MSSVAKKPRTSPLTKLETLNIAFNHAWSEWCWDDPTMIEEMLDSYSKEFVSPADVRQFIDSMADHFDLDVLSPFNKPRSPRPKYQHATLGVI